MDTVTINLDFPRDVLLAADITEANAHAEIKKHFALYMFKERLLSFGKAAEFSGINKFDFMTLAGSKKISLNYDESDYYDDLKTIKDLAL